MASIQKRKSKSGEITYIGCVRVRPYDTVAKTFPTKADAAKWAKDLEWELRAEKRSGGSKRPDTTSLTIGGLIERYLKDPKTQTNKTYKEIARMLESFWVNRYASVKVLDFGVMQTDEARDRLNDGSRQPGTVNRYLSVMRKAWNWGRKKKFIPERSWPPETMLPEPSGRKRTLNDSELQRLYDAAESDEIMLAAIKISLTTGMRQGELLALTWADIDLVRGTAMLQRTKNGDTRLKSLSPFAVEQFQALRKRSVVSAVHPFLNNSGGPMRQSYFIRRWKRILRASKLVNFRWHDLRHCCASILAQNGSNLLEIGKVLGHRTYAATYRYSHLIPEAPVSGQDALDAKLRNALDAKIRAK